MPQPLSQITKLEYLKFLHNQKKKSKWQLLSRYLYFYIGKRSWRVNTLPIIDIFSYFVCQHRAHPSLLASWVRRQTVASGRLRRPLRKLSFWTFNSKRWMWYLSHKKNLFFYWGIKHDKFHYLKIENLTITTYFNNEVLFK